MKPQLSVVFFWLFLLIGSCLASAPPGKVSAPVVYENLMLILSTKDGVAAVVFTKDIEEGVAYRYRFLAKGTGAEQTGDGKVFEKLDRVRSRGPHGQPVTGVIDKGSQLFITAGPLKLDWSYSAKGRGWVYYQPEEMRVQIANAQEFAQCNLQRFAN